ncbi:MAG: hypothetical protein PHV39_02665 [Methanomicrobium sp.]|nr:hypothetical protein [Methanomicrobium sp.]
MNYFNFKKTVVLLAIMIVAGAVLVMPVIAAAEERSITETEQIVFLSVDESTSWDLKKAEAIEEKIDSVLTNAMLLRTYGLSTYNLRYIRTDTLQTP